MLFGDAPIAIIDHTYLPTEIARQCTGLKHVVFLGTGARSYMNPEELAELGIEVHLIRGYGDTAVAEAAIALMWAAARNLALHGPRRCAPATGCATTACSSPARRIGLIGFGGIGAEVARLAHGIGMKVLAWNRTPKHMPTASTSSTSTRCWRRATWCRCICC